MAAHHAFNFDCFFHCLFLLFFFLLNFFIFFRVSHVEKVQPEGVGHYAEAGQAHGRRSEHRIQLPSQQRIPHSRGQRNSDHIIDKGPEQVLMNIPQGRSAQPDGCRHIAEPAFHQYHIRRVNGNIGTCSDGNSDVRSCKSRRVVNSVTYHGHFSFSGKGTNDTFLPFRQYTRDDFVDAGLFADGFGGPLIVAGKHYHMNSHILQFSDRLRTVFLNDIRNRDNAGQHTVPAEKQRRLAFFGKFFRLFFQKIGNLRVLADKLQIAAAESIPV